MIKMIIDVAASSGGAITILDQYYDAAVATATSENQYIFVLSTSRYKKTKNIDIIELPWIKKSWIHRLLYEFFTIKKIIKNYNPISIISLQNLVTIAGEYEKQTIYIHQALPFAKHNFSIFMSPKLWVYQNIYSKMIKYSAIRAKSIIVQNQWMKTALIEKYKIDSKKIIIKSPEFTFLKNQNYCMDQKIKLEKETFYFFYPAAFQLYKNHHIIFEALSLMNNKFKEKIKVLFTLEGNESNKLSKLKMKIKKKRLPIEFIGYQETETMIYLYSKTTLLFPSYVETIGLPLLEAMQFNSEIIVADCEYSKDILKNYSKVKYFDPFDAKDLLNSIMNSID